ncbi:MAG: hypothetical protein ACYCPT_11675, partial [Acidimicrobiales bacterium]
VKNVQRRGAGDRHLEVIGKDRDPLHELLRGDPLPNFVGASPHLLGVQFLENRGDLIEASFEVALDALLDSCVDCACSSSFDRGSETRLLLLGDFSADSLRAVELERLALIVGEFCDGLIKRDLSESRGGSGRLDVGAD